MTIEKTVNGNEVTLKLRGWMDTQNAPAGFSLPCRRHEHMKRY